MLDTVPDHGRPWPRLPRTAAERPLRRRCTWIVGPGGSGRTTVVRALAAGGSRGGGTDAVLLDDLASLPPRLVVETLADVAAGSADPARRPILVTSDPDDTVDPEILHALRSLGVDRRVLPPLTLQEVADLLGARWQVDVEGHTAARIHSLSGGRIGVLRAVVDDALEAGDLTVRHGMLRVRGDVPLSHATLYLDTPREESAEAARILDAVAVADGLPTPVVLALGGVDTAGDTVEDLIAAGTLLPDDSGDLLRLIPELERHHRAGRMDPGLRRHRLAQVDAAAARIGSTDTAALRPPADLPAETYLLAGPWRPREDPGTAALEVLVRSGACFLPTECPDDLSGIDVDTSPASVLHDLVVAALSGDTGGLTRAAAALRGPADADPRVAAAVVLFESYGLLLAGHGDEATAVTRTFRRRHRLTPRLSAVADLCQGSIDLAVGELDGARRCFTVAAAEFHDEAHLGWAAVAAGGLAYIGALTGNDSCRTLGRDLIDRLPAEWGLWAPTRAGTLAWAADPQLDDSRTADGLAEAYRAAVERAQGSVAMVYARELLRIDGEHAARFLDSLPGSGEEVDHVRRCRAATLDGDVDELERMGRHFRDRGARVFAVAAYSRLALAHREAGRAASAAEAAGVARELARECGGLALPSLRLLASFAELSPREREVTRYVARGMTNREIAAEMTLSVRTVEGHVMRACRRLGVETRAQLAETVTRVRG